MKLDTKITKKIAQMEVDKIKNNSALNDEQKTLIYQNRILQIYKEIYELDKLRKSKKAIITVIQKEAAKTSNIGWNKFQYNKK